MLRSVLFQNRRKIFTYIFITLMVLLCFNIYEINFAQSPSPEEVEKMKSIQIINPHSPFSLKLWLDNQRGATYTPGEKIRISFQASQDSFVTLYNYDTVGRVKIIFPNQYTPHNSVRAGQTYSIEGVIDPNSRVGTEYVQGFATSRQILITDRQQDLISKEFMPEVSPDFQKHTQNIKSIIVSMPSTAWASSNLLSYQVIPITPPPPPPPPPVNYGRILVTSQPQGAKVYLDNTYRGTTPLNLDRIISGQHHIKLVLAGYEDWSNYISVSPSRTSTVSTSLIPLAVYGSISIYCNQGSAKIYLDGNYQKTTSANKSVKLKDIEQGYHELMITKNGYQQWVNTILVKTNQTYMISAYLVPEIKYEGSIAVYCNVSGAKIFLNGTYKTASLSSQAKMLEEIKEGQYEITLIKDGYRTWVQDIWVYANETNSLYVEMEKIEY
ncbi:MAG TPA: PEGA domain-containing protein [Candidatus Atribacteria bacterium]|nr:PEGA domain-containing protein [Candidatus Atribacteria bacterium]